MAKTYTSIGSGNWSDSTKWDPGGGTDGTYPASVGSGDTVIIAGHTITLDATAITDLSTRTLVSITGNNASSVLSITGNTAITFSSSGIIYSSTSTSGFVQIASGVTLTLNGAGAGTITVSSTGAGGYAIVGTGTAALTVSNSGGTAVSHSGSSGRAINWGATGTLSITGLTTSTSGGYALYITGACNWDVDAVTCTAGGYAIYTGTSASTGQIDGDVTYSGTTGTTSACLFAGGANITLNGLPISAQTGGQWVGGAIQISNCTLNWTGSRTLSAGTNYGMLIRGGTLVLAVANTSHLTCANSGNLVIINTGGTITKTATGHVATITKMTSTATQAVIGDGEVAATFLIDPTLPAAGDVDDTAADYGYAGALTEPTCHLPDVAEVQDGVFFGEDETEFEGTYVGGGGYTYGDEDPDFVLTTADGAGHYHPPEAAEVISTATFGADGIVAGTYDVSDVSAGNIIDGASIGGVAGTYPLTATTQAADAAILEAEKAYLLATKTITFGASSVTGTLSVSNVLTAVTGGTYVAIAQANARYTGSGYYGAAGAVDGTCVVPAAADVRKTVNVDATTGTLVGCVDSAGVNQGASGVLSLASAYTATGHFDGTDVTDVALWTLISGVVAAAYVIEGHDNYTGGDAGTYHEAEVGEVEDGVFFGAGSVLEGTYSPGGTYDDGYAAGLVDQYANDQADVFVKAAYIIAGQTILEISGTFLGIVDVTFATHNSGTLDSGRVYHATGVIYGAGDYATEASRNTDPGESYVLTGHDYTILGAAKTASYSPDFPAVGNVRDTDTVNGAAGTLSSDKILKSNATGSGAGNYNDDNLSVGNVRPVAFGVGLTGTLANLVATDAAYVSLEESRNNDNGTVADDLVTGKSVKIRNSTTSGAATLESHTANQVLKSAGGNYNDDNLTDANVRPVAYGLSHTGDLSGLLATDAAYVSLENSRNDPDSITGAKVLTGYAPKIRNTTYTGSATAESHTADQVVSTAGGNWNIANLSVGNVIQDVAFGLGLTGTGANLLATHTTFLSLEAGRNSKTAGAGQILSTYSVTIAGVTTNGTFNEAARNTDPGVANVLDGVTYKILNVSLEGEYVGTVTPDTPTLTIADNEDGTGAVVTIAGSTTGSTNQIYTVSRSGGSWTLSGSRTGNGTVAVTLTTGGYAAFCLSSKSGGYSVSATSSFTVTDTTQEGRVKQICEAVVDLLDTADGDGEFTETLGATRAYMTMAALEDLANIDVLVVPSHSIRRRISNGSYRRDVTVEILVRKRFTNDSSADVTSADGTVTLVEQIDDYLGDPDNSDLTLSDGAVAIYVEPTDARAEAESKNDLGTYWHWEHVMTLRQLTGIVRATYTVDEAY